ncbi:hypothetical protein MANY_38060 [Mycolicibacterium anyangense]|uniref:Uncharacterized protein n=1 Tax=Mycolicibacterium anyangense TaxID=1431246 RepID=A0A6N4WBQ6_9MYCO|nr:hypothetical protein [Mycolicibacterium anyangense]BBZ78469.1 hypothetical protein MANY_38060 [Mycolicibacterium anyangense]
MGNTFGTLAAVSNYTNEVGQILSHQSAPVGPQVVEGSDNVIEAKIIPRISLASPALALPSGLA